MNATHTPGRTLSAAQISLLRPLSDFGVGLSAATISEASGVHTKIAPVALDHLVKLGLADRTWPGIYTITREGRSALTSGAPDV